MSDKSRRRLIEWGKNLLIFLLTLSALYQLIRIQLRADLPEGGILSAALALFQAEEPAPDAAQNIQAALDAARPGRLAICRDSQRWGIQYDVDGVDAAFGELSTLLSEALGSAEPPSQVSEADWRTALGRDGIYYDFFSPLPLSILSAWLEGGAGNPALSGSARRMCLAGDGTGAVALYYHNEDDGLYYACETTLSQQVHLDAATAEWLPNGACFAFEAEGMEALDPYTLLVSFPQPCVFTAGSPLAADPSRLEELLSVLSFRGDTLDYLTGGQVIEGTDTLRLSPDGTMVFHSISGEEARFPIPGESTLEILNYVCALANTTAGAWCGDARLCLSGVNGGNGRWEITFQSRLEGAPVSLPHGRESASFLVSEGAVTDFTLYLRAYAATGERIPVLPEQLAAAAMEPLGAGGKELCLCYQDGGGDQVSAGWAAF